MDEITEGAHKEVHAATAGVPLADLSAHYRAIRRQTEVLCAPLAIEDYVVQSRMEVSPAKWHLAHTTWFFEQFLLQPFAHSYLPFDSRFAPLFNSYYLCIGDPFPRSQRGTLSRPTVEEVYRYRAFVDSAMEALLLKAEARHYREIATRLELGLNHEQQHQELLLMDLKYNFAANPLYPTYHSVADEASTVAPSLHRREFAGGLCEIGASCAGFAFDNERPRHQVMVQPFALASRLVTNGEYLHFMEEGGYTRPEFWLSDGWTAREREGWSAPQYWRREGEQWMEATLAGLRSLNHHEPVAHVSYYEADAYARWAGKRLPREAEWEQAAAEVAMEGNLLESGWFHPTVAPTGKLTQMIGDLWEWTQSPYVAYPGYRRSEGPFGEYNGKFMCNQMVMRGGCCATPRSHLRITYRNFFFPWDRWQFSGIRLTEDV